MTTGTITNRPSSVGLQSYITNSIKQNIIDEQQRIIDEQIKQLMLKSITRSKRIIGKNAIKDVVGKWSLPDMTTLYSKDAYELRNLTITKV